MSDAADIPPIEHPLNAAESRTDADAVARQENEGGPAVAQGTSGERLMLRPNDAQAGRLPSRRRRVR